MFFRVGLVHDERSNLDVAAKMWTKNLKRWRLDHLGIGKVHQQNGKDQDWNL